MEPSVFFIYVLVVFIDIAIGIYLMFHGYTGISIGWLLGSILAFYCGFGLDKADWL